MTRWAAPSQGDTNTPLHCSAASRPAPSTSPTDYFSSVTRAPRWRTWAGTPGWPSPGSSPTCGSRDTSGAPAGGWTLADSCGYYYLRRSPRLASTEQIFGTPYFDAIFLDQSLMLNRRKDGLRVLTAQEVQEFEQGKAETISEYVQVSDRYNILN